MHWRVGSLLALMFLAPTLACGAGFTPSTDCTATSGAAISASKWNNCITSISTELNALTNDNVSASAAIAGSKLNLTSGTGAATFGGNLLFTADNSYDIGATGATRPRDVHLGRDLYVADQIFERGRSAAQGEWTPRTYDAGDFSASGGMSWTLDAADLTTFAYTLVGKTMTLSLIVESSSVSGVVDTTLQVHIPGAFTSAKQMWNACAVKDNGTTGTGAIRTAAGGTTLYIYTAGLTNWAGSTNNTSVFCQITFEVQ